MACTEVKTIHSAKKRHLCDWCGESIEVGESYKKYRWFDGGDVGTVKQHPECFDAMNEMASEVKGDIEFGPGDHPRGCFCDFEPGCLTCQSQLGAHP